MVLFIIIRCTCSLQVLLPKMKHGDKGNLTKSQAKSQQQRKKRKQDRTRSKPRNSVSGVGIVFSTDLVLTPAVGESLLSWFLGFSNLEAYSLFGD